MTPRLIALDWGTSSLRAFLLGADGTVLERRAERLGIMQTPPDGFPASFAQIAGAWRRRWPHLPAIAAGMIGSAQGWAQAPYRRNAAGAAEMAESLISVPSGDGGVLHIVPGLAMDTPRAEVMRGEETQIIGALTIDPGLARGRLLLPGTHSKWAVLADGRIAGFATFMTGELFAVLRGHSILGRLQGDLPPDESGFDAGVTTARDGDGLAALLFSARAQVLLGTLPAAASLPYLSGLLIGDEIRGALAAGHGAGRLALVGDAALCARYRRALSHFGITDVPAIEGAAEAGLWRIACLAGLVIPEPVQETMP